MIQKFSEIVDIGLVKPSNQDAIFSGKSSDGKYALFVIADGMGGHYMGDLASNAIITEFEKWWTKQSATNFECGYDVCVMEIRNILTDENRYIFSNYTTDKQVCGSTVVILFVFDDKYFMTNVGDSRLYEICGNEAKQLSFDHTFGMVALKNGEITAEQMENDPKRDGLVEAIGAKKSFNSFEAEGTSEDKAFFLCSDGVYKSMEEALLHKILLKRWSPEKKAAYLKKQIIANGARDNYSMYFIETDSYAGKIKNMRGIFAAAAVFGVLLITLIILLILM